LALALFRYSLDLLGRKGFLPVLPPVLVREEAMFGTGFFPTDKANIYEIPSDGLYLTGTSEVALAGLHMGELLESNELPLRYAGYSTCFRREAGAAGKETHGMFACTSSTRSRCMSTRVPRTPGRSTSAWWRSRKRSCRGWTFPTAR